MRFSLVLSLSLVFAACGGSDKPKTEGPTGDPVEDPTDEPAMMTSDECEAAGGSVKGDIGDGSVQCDEGTVEIGNVSGGVEEQLCCQPTPDDAE